MHKKDDLGSAFRHVSCVRKIYGDLQRAEQEAAELRQMRGEQLLLLMEWGCIVASRPHTMYAGGGDRDHEGPSLHACRSSSRVGACSTSSRMASTFSPGRFKPTQTYPNLPE
jgi:hypothetical protein